MVSWLCKSAFFIVLFFLADRAIYAAFAHGLATYYGFNKDAQVLCVGYSHTVLGIDATALERALDLPVAKYAMSGANITDRFQMIRHYLSLHPNVHTVIYDVDARLFDSDGISSASYTLFLPFINHPIIADYLRTKATWKEYLISQLIKTARFRDQTLNSSIRGLFNKIENEKRTRIIKSHYKNYIERAKSRGIIIQPNALKKFYETISYLSSRNITVVLLYIPVIDFFNAIDKYKYQEIINMYKDIDEKNKKVIFLNYNTEFERQYDIFFDPQHLNWKGKKLVTSRLSDDLKEIMLRNNRMEAKSVVIR
jgi:hypothetical protein